MNAILVSVDYSDLLAITLPHNRHHFDRVLIVTSPSDVGNVLPIAEASRAEVYSTDSFYADGAAFNKWKALEEGLDVLGREEWLCVMDADVLWPKKVSFHHRATLTRTAKASPDSSPPSAPTLGYLYTPLRRMCPTVPKNATEVPAESEWRKYPVHRNVGEWAGYSQVFHAEDLALGEPPWYDTSWRTAAGADSFFQMRWSSIRKIRPPFEVLHLGPAGTNWCGRISPYADGSSVPKEEREARHRALQEVAMSRRQNRRNYDNPVEKIQHLPPSHGGGKEACS